MAPALTRRRLGQAAGGALVIAFSLFAAPRPAAAQATGLPGSLANNRGLDAWLSINADGAATVFTGKVELGQGILTALHQIAAEELDLPLARVTLVSGDTARTPDEGYTAGSQSIEYGGTAMRFACAEARALLLEQAARQLGVPAERLSVVEGVVSAPNGRKLGYDELAAALDLHREATAKVPPKPPARHAIVGQSILRSDIPAKVTGGRAYVQDIRMPDMAHGRVVRPPRYGAKLETFDLKAVRAMPGVLTVVRDGSFLGVVAEREEQAIKARDALAAGAKWSGGSEMPDPEQMFDYLMALPTQTTVVSEKQAAASAAAKTLEATYRRPYQAHASIGPSCAVAEFRDGKLTVWTHSQGVFPLRRDLAKALRMDAGAVRCIHAEGSGCYGHNGADDVALDAALLARAAGRPVRVQWMRDDEFAWEPYGSAMQARVKAALDESGRIVDWQYEVFSNTHSTRPAAPGSDNNLLASWYLAQPSRPGPATNIPQPAGGGDRNAVPLYDFPNQRIVNHLITAMPVRVSALRTLGAYANVFALESFMDELAAAAGADPVAFRLAHLKDPRARAVIEAVASRAGWKDSATRGDGARGRGIGFAKYKNLSVYVAVVAEIEIDRSSGTIGVSRAFAVADAGQVINPDGLINQIEGGMIQSTSWTLHEAVQFDRTGIVSRDWTSYPILTMPEVPRIVVDLIDRPGEKPLGVGEGAQGPMAAAIANAFAHATGKRLRDLPFDPERVKAVLG